MNQKQALGRRSAVLKITFTLLLAGCGNPNTTKSSDLGGVSGGGGIVLPTQVPSNNASSQEAEELIQQGHDALVPFLQTKFLQLKNSAQVSAHDAIYAKLFLNAQVLFAQIEKNPPYIEKRGACLDRNRQPVDACIFSPMPNTICISAISISRKLNSGEIKNQAEALFLHEYSELAGFDEAQAVQVQNAIAQELSR